MAQSPRLLRPANNFTPRSISGLALWLDASSADTLYTTDAGPVTAVREPTDISGCVLWLDGADSSTASMTLNGSLVETWKDKSGSGNNATATGTARPTLTSSGLNGKSVVTFDGTANAMQIAANAAFNTSDVTYIIVFKQAAAANKGVYTKINASAGTNGFGLAVRSDPQIWLLQKNAGAAQVLTSSANPTTQARIYSVTSSSSATGYLDGLSSSTGASTADHSLVQRVMVGSRDSSEYLNGYIAEVIHYNRVLTRSELAQVEALLATKWGIAGVHAPATATSDPVGAWLDKSGNARHATQATAGSRPTVGASSAAGKNAVRNNGTGTVALQVAAWPYTAGNTQFAVFNASAINQGIIQRGSLNDEPRMAIQTGANGVAAIRGTRGGSVLAQTHSEVGYALSQWTIGATLFNTSLGRTYRDGVYGTDTTDSQTFSGDQELRLLSLPSNIYGLNGGIAELLYYDRQLTATEVTRVARYLSSRWGITLAPQVSNADAQNWIDRVYTNGGTVSASTAAAVNTLCDSLDAASLRDRFYRLNLFCGSNLNAALVPLYRGPSLGGTQYGNTTDTNVGPFVTGDYNETGASGGLANTGRSKYLNTGFPTSTLTAGDRHLAFYARTFVNADYDIFMGSESAASISHQFALGHQVSASDVRFSFGASTSSIASAGSVSTGAFWLGVHGTSTAGIVYKNGVSDGTGTLTAATPTASEMHIFGINRASLPANVDRYGGTSGGYSVGLGMTDSQAAAYYNAMQAFQTALTRNV
jgi:hypothetical protein